MNTLYQPRVGGVEEEAMLEPIIPMDLGSKEGSRITKEAVGGVEGGLEGASLGHSVDSIVFRGLLRLQGARGGR